jgi:hypothetical protein
MTHPAKFWTAMFAILAAAGILFVLITPAPDELPTTGPHALNKVFLPPSDAMYLLPHGISPTHGTVLAPVVASAGIDLLSLTCTRLC